MRDCYKTYYNLVIELLEENKYISVTGTPGIGKSIFYDHFFSRYRREHSEVTIVTVSFDKDRMVMKCVVLPLMNLRSFGIFPNIEKRFPGAIHLYDGSPRTRTADSKMIAFTSPKYEWLDSMQKESVYDELYMPVWTSLELLDAVDCLSLNIDSETLAKRFDFFGGVARFCLTLKSRFYKRGIRQVKAGVAKIESLERFRECFTDHLPLNKMVHRLLHYYPKSDPTEASLKAA